MNEQDDRAAVARAEHAKQLLNDSLLKDALDAIETEVVKAWGECPLRDAEGKEALWQLFKTAQKFRGMLVGHVETGKLAAHNLKQFEERKGLRRVFG